MAICWNILLPSDDETFHSLRLKAQERRGHMILHIPQGSKDASLSATIFYGRVRYSH